MLIIILVCLCYANSNLRPHPPSQITANRCGFHHVNFVPTLGLAGGFWLLWKDCSQSPFNLVVIFKASRFMACSISLLNENLSFVIIFVYAPSHNAHKFEFWEEVIVYVNLLTLPFIILGDFNDIGCEQDKFRGAPFNLNRIISNMENILSSISAIEIPFLGSRFTWRKKRASPNNLLERLDRGIASPLWLSWFPQAKLIHHPFTSSDHCQVSLDLSRSQSFKAPPFKFEKMWCLRKDYDTLVKKTWC